MLEIADITVNSITIDRQNLHFDQTPEPRDVLIIGDYFGDNRIVQTRAISVWDGNWHNP